MLHLMEVPGLDPREDLVEKISLKPTQGPKPALTDLGEPTVPLSVAPRPGPRGDLAERTSPKP